MVDKTLAVSDIHAEYMRQKLHTVRTKQNDLRQALGLVGAGDASERIWAAAHQVRGFKQEDHALALLHITFDEHWVAVMRGMEDLLDAIDAHHVVARDTGEVARAYMNCHSSQQHGYDSLLIQYKTLQAKRSMVENSLRASFKELAFRLTAIANVLVDGGLFRSEISEATLRNTDAAELRARVGNSSEVKDFFEPKVVASMLDYVASRLEDGVSGRWLQQTQAAFNMGEELLLRHRDFGIREDGPQLAALKTAWELVASEATNFSPARVLAEFLHGSLPHLAPVPEGCESEGVATWGRLSGSPEKDGDKLLLLDPSVLFTTDLGSGWRLEMTNDKVRQSMKAKVCEKGASSVKSVWALRDVSAHDGVSICDVDFDQSQPCTFRISTRFADHLKVQ